MRSARDLVHRCELVAVAARATADAEQQPLRVLAEEAEQEQLLLARRHAFRVLAHLAQPRRDVLLAVGIVRQLDRAGHGWVDRAGRRPERAGDERAQLVDDREIAARGKDVEQCLRCEHLADRCGERRPSHLGADAIELLEDLLEPVGRALRAQRRVEARDEARGDVVLRSANGDARGERRDRLVADVIVDEVRCLPQTGDVDTRVEPHAGERVGERLAGHSVQRQCERIDRARDQLRAGFGRLQRRGERGAACALEVDADGQAARLSERMHEALRLVRKERAGRVVQQHAHGTELGQCLRALDEHVDLAGRARAVDEARLEVAVGRDDRLGRFAQVGDVVERVVEPEDVDAVLRGRGDEAAGEVGVDRARRRRGSVRAARARAAS